MKSILLTEDDPFLIDIYNTKLKESGFKVEIAKDGEEALKKIRKKNCDNLDKKTLWPDLLILDIVLPRLDGWQVLREIKKDDKFKNLKVIIFTNLYQKGEVQEGLALGATKYLIKAHYTPTEVVEEIKKILK